MGGNIKLDLEEIGLEACGLDLSGTGQGPVAGSCDHASEASDFINFFTIS
jgi:hypothetical protein